MPRRRSVPVPARAPRSSRAPAKPRTLVRPRASRLLIVALLGWSVLTLAVLFSLKAYDVRLGQGALFYRYSAVSEYKLVRAMSILPIIALAAGAIWLISRRLALLGTLCAAVLAIVLALWIWYAPPAANQQHALNLRSPSHDGAFVLELMYMKDLPSYLRGFDQHIQRTPKELLGTRTISNPPGATVLAYTVREMFPVDPRRPDALDRYLLSIGLPADDLEVAKVPLMLGIALSLIYVAGVVAAYWLGRVFLPPAGSLLLALLIGFNPSVAHFAPGKDAAQLLTICLMLLAWFAAWKRRSAPLAAAAGALLVIGTTMGLIHLWVAAAALVATAWQDWAQRRPMRAFLVRLLLPATAGAAAVVLAVLLIWGWNMPATFLAVARRFGELQKTFEIDRTIYFLIGLPIFLLFVGPGLAALVVLRLRRWRWSLASRLLVCTAIVMAITYLTGVTYELPRLWIAFLPPLTVGALAAAPLARASRLHPLALRALMVIAAIHMLTTAMHWSRLDVREAEYRLARDPERMLD